MTHSVWSGAALAGLLCLSIVTAIPAAAEPVIRYRNVVEPDAELSAMLDTLRTDLARGKNGRRAVEKAFAPKVAVFTRGLDPLQPWNALTPVGKDPLDGLSDVMVEKAYRVDAEGNQIEDTTDYRIEVMAMIAAILADDTPFGALDEVPGGVCKPAALDVAAPDLTDFAASQDKAVSAIQFFTTDVDLHKAPKDKARRTARVAAFTPMLWDFEKDLPTEWSRMVAADGATGYLKNRDDAKGMSQSHVCFAKVKGRWAISAAFGYGL